jgi:hypothetical protein
MEDLLRGLGSVYLPTRGKDDLNAVPLAGTSMGKRAEKFFLGDLLKFSGQTVEQIIQASVKEHLNRTSFNSTTDVSCYLTTLGIDPKPYADYFQQVDRTIKRRHVIVHHADIPDESHTVNTVEGHEGVVFFWSMDQTFEFCVRLLMDQWPRLREHLPTIPETGFWDILRESMEWNDDDAH